MPVVLMETEGLQSQQLKNVIIIIIIIIKEE